MIANIATGTIRLLINGNDEVLYHSEQLKDRSITWVPFVWMHDVGDWI